MSRDIVFDVIEACCVFADMVIGEREPSHLALSSAINNIVGLTSMWIETGSRWQPGVNQTSALLAAATRLTWAIEEDLGACEMCCKDIIESACRYMDATESVILTKPPGWAL